MDEDFFDDDDNYNYNYNYSDTDNGSGSGSGSGSGYGDTVDYDDNETFPYLRPAGPSFISDVVKIMSKLILYSYSNWPFVVFAWSVIYIIYMVDYMFDDEEEE